MGRRIWPAAVALALVGAAFAIRLAIGDWPAARGSHRIGVLSAGVLMLLCQAGALLLLLRAPRRRR